MEHECTLVAEDWEMHARGGWKGYPEWCSDEQMLEDIEDGRTTV